MTGNLKKSKKKKKKKPRKMILIYPDKHESKLIDFDNGLIYTSGKPSP